MAGPGETAAAAAPRAAQTGPGRWRGGLGPSPTRVVTGTLAVTPSRVCLRAIVESGSRQDTREALAVGGAHDPSVQAWAGALLGGSPAPTRETRRAQGKKRWRSMFVRPVRCAPQPAAAFGGQQRAAPAAFLPSTPNPAAPNCRDRWVVKSSTLRRMPRESGSLTRVTEDACSQRKPGERRVCSLATLRDRA